VGAFQVIGQQPIDEEKWCLAAAMSLPKSTKLSLHNADEHYAHFREIHPYDVTLIGKTKYKWIVAACQKNGGGIANGVVF
jgi:hypothetical protein